MNNLGQTLLVVVALSASACRGAESVPARSDLACHALGGDPAKAAAPFYDAGNVYAAQPIRRTVSRTKAFENRQIAGAELYMRATPGVTAEYLQRALSCHHTAGTKDAHPNDPLRPRGNIDEIGVRSTGVGFVVVVTSDDATTAKEIWQRSQAFAGADASADGRQLSE